MSLTQVAIKRPVTTLMVFLCCVVLGAISATRLPLEQFPEVEFPGIFINVPYAGSTPEEVERIITKPVEEVLGTISNVKRMSSQSSEGGAGIFMEFDWGEDVGLKAVEAREKLDGIRNQLPDDLERYFVNMFSTADDELLQFRISSDRDLSGSYEMLNRNLKRRVERLDGVGKVELYGVEEKEIRIELDSDRLTAHNINLGALFQTLQNSNFSLAAGRITDGNQRLLVRPVGEFKTVDELKNVVVGAGNVRLRDVANVFYESPIMDHGRHLDRNYAIGLDVFKASGHNTVDVAARVMSEIESIKQDPEMSGISLITFDDQAESVKSSLRDLFQAGILGAVLAFVVLFFFLRQWSTTLIVSLAVPISIFITLIALYFLGLTLNILSLMGLMLAVGMLVDNAVVITESIHQEQLQATDMEKATIKGVKHVAVAVTAGTLTTAIVFLPTIVSPADQVTLFLKHVSIALCVALLASLIISQTIIPLLTARLKPPKPKDNVVDRLVIRYGKFLDWSLRHRGFSVALVFGLLFSVAIPMALVDKDMFPDEDQRRLRVFYNLHANYTLERVEEAVDEIEAYLFAHKDEFEIETVYSYYEGRYASSTLYLREEGDITDTEILKERIREGLPKMTIGNPSFEFNRGMGGSEAMSISIIGESSDQLFDIAKDVERVLTSIDGVKDVRTDADIGGEEVHVVVNRTRARQYGFSTSNVAGAIATAMRGQNLRRFRTEEGEINVRLAFQDSDQQSLDDLKNLPLVNPQGQRVKLASVADFPVRRGPQTINHEDRTTVLGIDMELVDGFTISEARPQVERIMERVAFPPGYTWNFGRRMDREEQTEQILLINFLLALVLIYLVMAGLFESLITPAAIWTSIIFAIVGVMWFLFITGTTFSIMAAIGVLILIGIVVNNGIVLLDHVIQLRSQGVQRIEALVRGGKDRLRPILMTVLTTVLGLVPLCLGTTQIGGDGPPYFPMARAIVGGLLFSTIVTLLVLPTIYLLLDDLRNWSRRVAKAVVKE